MQRTGKKAKSKEIRNVVRMAGLKSAEHFVRECAEPRRVLDGVFMRVDRGQVWGVTARTACEIRLLLEVMGNITPYEDGKCVLAERGMMRRKRVILPHVFYIGGADMLYGNMNVLEYLCFATERQGGDRLAVQEELFERLIDFGLGHVSLAGIRWLTEEERAAVALLAAAHSDCLLVVFNLPEWQFDERLQGAIAKTAALMAASGKALVLGTLDKGLIQRACSHTAFVAEGRTIYQGRVNNLRRHFDKAAVIIEDGDIGGLKGKLAPVLVGCGLAEKDGRLQVMVRDEAVSPLEIYQRIAAAGIAPRGMRVNEKTVDNAYEELMRRHDLLERLV